MDLIQYLNKTVKVIMDRPLTSLHPKYGFEYPVNYGYLPNTLSGDGEEIDAYIIGVDYPVKEFTGKVIAVIIRHNDLENKLVVSNRTFTKPAIKKMVHFQEKYFDTEIVMSTTDKNL